jgi:hypothetical protein
MRLIIFRHFIGNLILVLLWGGCATSRFPKQHSEFEVLKHFAISPSPTDSLLFTLIKDSLPDSSPTSFDCSNLPPNPFSPPSGLCFRVSDDSAYVRAELAMGSDSLLYTPVLDTILQKGFYWLIIEPGSTLKTGVHFVRRRVGDSVSEKRIIYVR